MKAVTPRQGPHRPDPRAVRRTERLWILNIGAAFALALLSGAASVFLWLLATGTVTQPAPLDDDVHGQALILSIVALIFLFLGIALLRRYRRTTAEQRHGEAKGWNSPLG